MSDDDQFLTMFFSRNSSSLSYSKNREHFYVRTPRLKRRNKTLSFTVRCLILALCLWTKSLREESKTIDVWSLEDTGLGSKKTTDVNYKHETFDFDLHPKFKNETEGPKKKKRGTVLQGLVTTT